MLRVGAMLRTATTAARPIVAIFCGARLQQRLSDREPREKAIVDGSDREHDGQPVEPGEIAAGNQDQLKDDRQKAGDAGIRLRQEEAERHDQLDEMVEGDAAVQHRTRQVMEVPAERIGHRLGLEEVVETGQIAPAGVAAQLDQAGAEHQAEQRPAVDPVQQGRWRRDARAGEHREEPDLDEQRFPAEAVPCLAGVDERQIQHVQSRPHRCSRQRADAPGDAGQRHE
jgi:hypothetical protein